MKILKRSEFILILLMVISVFLYSEPIKYQYSIAEVKINIKNIPLLQKIGLPLEEAKVKINNDYIIYTLPVTQYDLKALKKNKIYYKIVIEDAPKFYSSRNTQYDLKLAENYKTSLRTEMELGSMGGFYTVEELYATLDKLYKKYGSKNLISKRVSIGKSYEGRDIYVVKISDNVDKDESDIEPQVLYTALIHAREPAGMMTVIYFMYYLLENYDKDQRVKNIVDNRELYFIPLVNPDGYAYNQKTHPNGGGMCRKNRHGSGVDLNRNFGPYDLWDYPNGGSSTYEWSQTYRGTAPFSEPETAALRDFVMNKKFRTAINYHTYSNLLIYPWGIKDEVAHPFFKVMAKEMTKINGYRYGTAEGLLYAVRGVSDDWFYKVKNVFAVTVEVGGYSDGFWPRASRIFPLAEENLESNLLLAEYAGQVPTIVNVK